MKRFLLLILFVCLYLAFCLSVCILLSVFPQATRTFSSKHFQLWIKDCLSQNPYSVSACIALGTRLTWPFAGIYVCVVCGFCVFVCVVVGCCVCVSVYDRAVMAHFEDCVGRYSHQPEDLLLHTCVGQQYITCCVTATTV